MTPGQDLHSWLLHQQLIGILRLDLVLVLVEDEDRHPLDPVEAVPIRRTDQSSDREAAMAVLQAHVHLPPSQKHASCQLAVCRETGCETNDHQVTLAGEGAAGGSLIGTRSSDSLIFRNSRFRFLDACFEILFLQPVLGHVHGWHPSENGYIESFNGKLRDELLNGEIFFTLTEAKVIVERWRQEYNTRPPHSSLGYRPPAPETIAIAPPLGEVPLPHSWDLDAKDLTLELD